MHLIRTGQPGKLWIMPCPAAARLDIDVAEYRSAGVGRVVSMLAVDEALGLGLADEAGACSRAGIAFEQHPIADFGLPDIDGFKALTKRIVGHVKSGEGVAVHCRAGIGRSGMVTAGVLIALGFGTAEAVRRVSDARGASIPDTVEQGRFIAALAPPPK